MADVKRFDSRLHHMSLLWLHGCADMTAGRSRVAPKLVLWNFLLLNLAPYFNLLYKKPKITKDQVAHTNANIEPNLQRITRVSRETEMIFYIFSQCWLSCVQIAQVSSSLFSEFTSRLSREKSQVKIRPWICFWTVFPPHPLLCAPQVLTSYMGNDGKTPYLNLGELFLSGNMSVICQTKAPDKIPTRFLFPVQVFFASVRPGGSSQVYFMTLGRSNILSW